MRTPADLMSWLDGVLDHAQAGTLYLAGHSYGGWVALTYASHRTPRVAKLALLDPTSCFAGLSPGYLWHGVPALLRPSATRTRRLIGWETQAAPVPDPAWVDLAAIGAQARVASKLVRPRRPTAKSLRAATVPTAVLLAERSRCHNVASVAAHARELMPQAQTQVLPDVSHHSMPMRHPDRLNRALLEFFGQP